MNDSSFVFLMAQEMFRFRPGIYLRGFHLQKDFKSIEKIANNIQGTD
jgi:hypothetical protein